MDKKIQIEKMNQAHRKKLAILAHSVPIVLKSWKEYQIPPKEAKNCLVLLQKK